MGVAAVGGGVAGGCDGIGAGAGVSSAAGAPAGAVSGGGSSPRAGDASKAATSPTDRHAHVRTDARGLIGVARPFGKGVRSGCNRARFVMKSAVRRSPDESNPDATMRIIAETAIITGASSGIGAELARQLAAKGVKVGLTARREPELHALAASIREAGGTAVVAPADAADPASTRAAFARLLAELGPVDLLIANAGVGVGESPSRFSAEAFDRMVRVNLIAVGYAIEAVLPSMLERRRGQIVGISSLAAYRGLPGSAGYSATKAGLSTFLEGLRPQLRYRGISVTTVHPGFVRTEMTSGQKGFQPFLMDADRAARIILREVGRRRRRVDFPWPMVAVLRAVQMIPGGIYDRIADRLVNGS
jgi:short-subunit dehydrogenase